MAKRRRLTAPTAEDLAKLDEGFAAKPPLEKKSMVPPIAQVAGEAAALNAASVVEGRVGSARDKADAARLREAEAAGLLVREVALKDIKLRHLSRDRLASDAEEMEELKASIKAHGLRMPVELSLPSGDDPRFGLISGWRRIGALRALLAETGDEKFARVRALVRTPEDAAGAYVAMVEENEIRADLSQYERGRIAVVAAGQGAFASIEAAVDTLFAAGSKAKRSKIRSFAAIHEDLGDVLSFATDLSERAGLRLAAALRSGLTARVREALSAREFTSAAEEWTAMEPLIREAEQQGADASRGGRPRQADVQVRRDVVALAEGMSVHKISKGGVHSLRFEGPAIDEEALEVALKALKKAFGK